MQIKLTMKPYQETKYFIQALMWTRPSTRLSERENALDPVHVASSLDKLDYAPEQKQASESHFTLMHTYLKFNRAHSDALSGSLVRIEQIISQSPLATKFREPVLNLLEQWKRKNSVSEWHPTQKSVLIIAHSGLTPTSHEIEISRCKGNYSIHATRKIDYDAQVGQGAPQLYITYWRQNYGRLVNQN